MRLKGPQKYYDACMRTDLPAALRAIRNNNSPFAKRARARFKTKTERTRIATSDPFVKKVVELYRAYYRRALLQPKKEEEFSEHLLKDLVSALNDSGFRVNAKIYSWKKLEPQLKKELRRRGFYSLIGFVAPFRCLMLWKTEKPKTFTAKLASHTQKVKVVLMDEFLELGWMHFATFGRYYVGGWARKDALYCVAQAYQYKFESERFRVSYLQHEAQHLADLRAYPKIKSHELEYRAKLAELAASRFPIRLARRFFTEARNDKKLPHCYASHLLKKALLVNGAAPGGKNLRSKAAELLTVPPAAHR